MLLRPKFILKVHTNTVKRSKPTFTWSRLARVLEKRSGTISIEDIAVLTLRLEKDFLNARPSNPSEPHSRT